MPADKMSIRNALVKIKVFGVGGGGNNVLLRMLQSDFLDVELVAVNTDAKQLSTMQAAGIASVQIGEMFTKGRGTGGKVEVGIQAAKNDAAKLKAKIKGADLIFITAGMGGGTGTGVAPFIAEMAKDLGILTIGVVTIPFSFEGNRKKRMAMEGIVKMQSHMDALIKVNNDNLMKLPGNSSLSMVSAFKAADEVLKQAIRCLAELILRIGFVNVDFADVVTVFRQSVSSDALLGIGRSSKSAMEAVKQAVSSPLVERSLQGARGIILNITGDSNLSLYDVNEATQYIMKTSDKDVNIIFGTIIDDNMHGDVQATVIATDFVDSMALKAPRLDSVPATTVTGEENKTDAPQTNDVLNTPGFMTKQRQPTNFAIPAFKLTPDKK